MNQQIIYKSLQVITAVSANLLLPGAGFVIVGYYQRAFQVQALLLLFTLLICWSRWVFTPAGSQTLFVIFITIYIFNTLLLLIHISKNKKRVWRYKQGLYALLFIIMGYGVLLGGFMTKQHWLGVHIYFVPSMSMHPTLKPGQFILLDSWIYQAHKPKLNDITVFNHDKKYRWLVKRISNWPNGELQHDGNWYLLGDNQAQSQDSRYFGGVTSTQIIGQVKLILLEINNQQQPQKGSFFQPVE